MSDTLRLASSSALELLGDLFTTVSGGTLDDARSSVPNFEGGLDWYILGLLTVAVLLVNWLIRLVAVQPICGALIKATTGDVNKLGARSTKMAQSVMEILTYSGFFIVGVQVLFNQAWVWPSAQWWTGGPSTRGGDARMTMRNDFRVFYLLYCARYIAGLISVFMEHKRKDFLEMVIHHLATALLVAASYYAGCNRIGGVVMVLLDVGDPPLHIAKVCRYLAIDANQKEVNGKYQTGADVWFVIFAIIFAVTRVGMYPYCVWSASVEAGQVWGNVANTNDLLLLPYHAPPEFICVVLLVILMLLQFFWFGLLLKAAWGMIVLGKVEDNRSERYGRCGRGVAAMWEGGRRRGGWILGLVVIHA